MTSVDQWHRGSNEGANPSFRQQRSSSAPHRHPSHPTPNPNPNPIPAQHRQQRQPPMRFQVTTQALAVPSNRLWCPPPAATNSNPRSLEPKKAGMSLNEWWTNAKGDIYREAFLESLIEGGQHYREGAPDDQNRKATVPGELSRPTTGERRDFAGAVQEWRKVTKISPPIVHNYSNSSTQSEKRKRNVSCAKPNSLEARLAGITTMDEWRAVLSENVGQQRSTLHNEIVAFCAAQELTAQQTRVRGMAYDSMRKAVLEVWPTAQVHLYGSTAMGLALPTSDVDIVVVMQPAVTSSTPSTAERKRLGLAALCESPRQLPDTGPWVSQLYMKLLGMPDMFQSLTQLPHAKVPILKTVFKTGVACDVSFDWHHNRPGLGVEIVKHFLRKHQDLKPLCILLKSFLRYHKLNEVFTGGIGSYCLTVMAVSLLQSVPAEGAPGVPPCTDLGALLLSFFMYYSSMHNYVTDVVSLSPGAHARQKHARSWVNWNFPDRLAVENPLDPSADIGSGSYNIQDVRAKFSQAKQVLLRHWNEEKLLDRIFKARIG